MDDLIRRFDAIRDLDLMLCERRGIAYQKKMHENRALYDDAYFKKVSSYDKRIEDEVNLGRCALMQRNLKLHSTVLDIGAGSGEFMRRATAVGYRMKGFDVLPQTAAMLRANGMYSNRPDEFDAVTLWDTIEHLEEPHLMINAMRRKSLLFVSVPVFKDLKKIRESKHYRPGEHLYYWTEQGFIDWAALRGFRLIDSSKHEVEAGREGIGAYAFCRDFPLYEENIAAYKYMHATSFYGSSATELHLDSALSVVKRLNPRSIIDYGCGRSDLASHFYRDGERTIVRFDPAIAKFEMVPPGQYDLAFCCDVMEHVPMSAVDSTLRQLRSKSAKAFFTVSTKPARAKLPDGRNAHVTLLSPGEWMRWIKDYYGTIDRLPSKWETEVILLAGA